MRKTAGYLAVIVWLACSPAAQACKPVFHADPAADFIRDANTSPEWTSVIFTGEILSVSEHLDADGHAVSDMAVRTEQWWMGKGRGVVLVRSVIPLGPSCGPGRSLPAKEGERWLIFGWMHDGRIEPYSDTRVSMPLEHGRIPAAMARKLERIGRGPHPG